MSKWFKIVVANVLVLFFVVGGLGLLGFYLYQKDRYITTNDARVSANTINITALTAGKIIAWQVKPGDKVKDNSTIGTQQTAAAVTPAAAGSKPAVSARVAATGLPSTGTGSSGPLAAKPAVPAPPAKLDIKAPIEGTIIQNIVEPGQTVMPGQPLAMIADLDKVFVNANIEETRIKDIKPGQYVDITLDAFPGETFSGRVVSFTRATASTFSLIPTGTTSGSYTKVTQKIPVQISIDTGGKEVLPGMSASVSIEK